MEVYNFKNNQPVSWYRKSLAKSNQRCLYCNRFIGSNSELKSNKEHLIARDFVPKGYFTDTTFNFIFRSCVDCNNKKSSLERHVSSVSLFNSSARNNNEHVDYEALRKASNDYHPDKKGLDENGILIKDSSSNIDLLMEKLKFGLIAPPQLSNDYVKHLALMHIQGLFSLITTTNPLCASALSTLDPGRFWLLGFYSEYDWGNHQVIEIIKRTKKWNCYCNVITANGYFKVIIKKNPEVDDYFWALEWNKNVRIVGAISNNKSPPVEFLDLPEIIGKSWVDEAGNIYKFFREVKLDCDDELFIG
ncbi:hypothetical protein L5L55_16125 [Shewanella glacialipiscicola]|uniref:hypothetical protein n=1 Tax=Shewanella glacialipiscicola TaxID=614069 RepID=UPI0021D815C7|nr:hypothetical protein [Shewanella glacialipiscicola]MCU7996402.1 hypothetical protein [Shewanella glacialipiscicola]MCU8027715.1 hypothetical protein [Shewanella glacialipiscicola]